MYSPNYQINSPDDEDEDQPEDGDISLISTAMQHGGFDSDSIRAKRRKTDFNGGGGQVVQPTGRKDGHSKVRTARGPRDRRVRLSPRTAIQFYDVQDRLGYDRPSKAIDWLINEAKAAIDELEELPTVAQDHAGFLLSGNPVSGFCFDGTASAAPSTTEFQGFVGPGDFALHQNYPHGFCYETNWKMARGGGGGGAGWCSAVNYPPPAQPVSGQSQREPLQSSFINYCPMNNDFAGFNFCNELSNITASATMKYDERERKQVYSKPASPFLHNQD